MADAGIGQQSAIGGYELGFGSKPTLHAITIIGRSPTDTGSGSVFVDGDSNVTVTGTGCAATSPHGAGYITFGNAAATAGQHPCTWTIGTGAHAVSITAGMPDGEDDTEIIMAMGQYASTAGSTGLASGVGALPGLCNITKIDGGTVSFILSCPHEDTDDIANGDGFRLTLMAWSKGGV